MCCWRNSRRKFEHFLLLQRGRGTIPHAQAPHRRQEPAPGKQVVALHGMAHVGTAEEIHVHASRRGDIDAHKMRRELRRAVALDRSPRRRVRFGQPLADGAQVGEVEAGVAGRIDVDAIAPRRDVERRRRVGVAQHGGLVVADADDFLAAPQLEHLEVHAQAVEVFVFFQGQLDAGAASAAAEADGLDFQRQLPARRQGRQVLLSRGMLLKRHRGQLLRLSEADPPHAGGDFVQPVAAGDLLIRQFWGLGRLCRRRGGREQKGERQRPF